MEDIYNQFEHSEEGSTGHGDVEHDDGGGGGVTGYALVDSKHIYAKPIEHEPGLLLNYQLLLLYFDFSFNYHYYFRASLRWISRRFSLSSSLSSRSRR